MQWKVEFDEARHFVRAKQWDEFSLDDQAKFLSDIFAKPQWHSGMGVLFDYRGLNVSTLDMDDLNTITVIFQSARKKLVDSKMALLCDSDELFDVGRAFGILLAPRLENQVVIFRDEEAALKWLTRG
ncbi:MAG: hypothetical protein DMF63_02795 [Acidobacteria bacterium]|nr:MAG: hypothetical protein DMF63_02795 [Acidobacteriota bacterium]